MDSGGRKILPRIRPSSAAKQGVEVPFLVASKKDEPTVNGADVQQYKNKPWRAPGFEPAEGTPKRKRQHIDDGRTPSQPLPSVQHLLTVPSNPNANESEMAGPCRLVHHPNGLYYHQGAFIFQSPSPGRDFPVRLSHDTRELSFAALEPDLFDVFKHTWYLRQYVRQRRLQGIDMLWDHVMMNDCYGIESVLHTWSSRYEPGTAQYPASMLYKQCLWLYFHRSIQPSHPTTAYSTVVDDGLHYLRTLEGLLGNADKSFLLIPIFLLGTTAFHPPQRQPVFRALERVDPQRQLGIFAHAVSILDLLWNMMDDGRVSNTWDWERCQSPEITQNVLDRSLVELLHDPFMPEYRPTRVRSPEPMVVEFDQARFRAVPGPAAAAAPPPAAPPPLAPAVSDVRQIRRDSSGEAARLSPSQPISPDDGARNATIAPMPDAVHGELKQERTMSQPELAPAGPRPYVGPPPQSAGTIHTNSELIQALTRKVAKSKSSVPPCPTCGKELKNPSDAQYVCCRQKESTL